MATKPIPVRIPAEWLPRLDAAASRLGTNRSRLIGFLAQTFAADFEKNGTAMLPPDWNRILESLDGRRTKSEPNLKTAAGVLKKVLSAAGGKTSSLRPQRVKKSAAPKHNDPSEQLKS